MLFVRSNNSPNSNTLSYKWQVNSFDDMTNDEILDHVLLRFRKVAEEALHNGTDLRGFQGEAMTKKQFKERMRSQFNLRLHPKEVDVIVAYFDKDGDELVDFVSDDITPVFFAFHEINQRSRFQVEVHGMFMNPERLQRASAKVDTRCEGKVLTMALLDRIAAKKAARKKHGESGATFLAKTFKRYDKDRSGTVNMDELKNVLNAMDIKNTPADLIAVFKMLDPNGDGSLSYGEFLDAYNNRLRLFGEETDKRRLKQAFKPPGCTAQAQELISSDRKIFLSQGDPYTTKLERDRKNQKSEKKRFIAGDFVMSGASDAKAAIETKAFMSENLTFPRLH